MKRPTHETCAALAAAIDAYVEKADTPSLADLLKRAGYEHVDRTLKEAKALEDRLAKIMDKYAMELVTEWQNRGGLDFYGILDAFLSGNPQADKHDGLNFIGDVAIAFRQSFRSLMPMLVRAYSAKIDDKLAVEGITKRTTAFVDSWSKELAQLMKLNTDNDIRKILDKALTEGKGVESATLQIIDAGIRGRSPNKSHPLRTDWRARRVALTEMLRAHSYAQLDAYRQNPAVTGKRWMHTAAKFSTARPAHVALDGTVVDVNGVFNVNGYTAQCPRDTSLPASESVNCHCLIQPVVDENILGMPLEERDRLWREAVEADDRAWEAEVDARRRLEALQYRGEDTTDAEADLAAIRAGQREAISTVVRMHDRRDGSIIEARYRRINGEHSSADDLAATNPNYSTGMTEWTENCQRCVTAYEARRRGLDVEAKPRGGSDDPLMKYTNGAGGWETVYKDFERIPCVSDSPAGVRAKVEDQMESWGDGARSMVYVKWSGTQSAHVFIAEQRDGITCFIDPQTNEADVGYYFNSAAVKNTFLIRLDDKEFTDLLTECIQNRTE